MDGQRLADLRQGKGFSQEELARRAGVHQTTVSLIERGTAQDLKTGTAQKLATALEVSVDDLLAELFAEPAAAGRSKTA